MQYVLNCYLPGEHAKAGKYSWCRLSLVGKEVVIQASALSDGCTRVILGSSAGIHIIKLASNYPIY